MALGKYAVDYEMRVDYNRLRRERLQRAKDQINKDGLGGLIGRHSKIPEGIDKNNPFSSWAKEITPKEHNEVAPLVRKRMEREGILFDDWLKKQKRNRKH